MSLPLSVQRRAVRVYTPAGREQWLTRPGQTVPAGWYDGQCQFLTEDHIVRRIDASGGWDERPDWQLVLLPISAGAKSAQTAEGRG